jgi:hypothetical protein
LKIRIQKKWTNTTKQKEDIAITKLEGTPIVILHGLMGGLSL